MSFYRSVNLGGAAPSDSSVQPFCELVEDSSTGAMWARSAEGVWSQASTNNAKNPMVNPFFALAGQTTNVVNTSYPARTNLEWGLGAVTNGAIAATGVGTFAAVPVDVGMTVSKVTVLVGGTGASTPTHQFAALYAGLATGAPTLMAQSTDTTTAAIAASGALTYTLATPQVITAANAPYGFVYAELAVTSSTQPTVASVGIPTAVGYQWFTNAPQWLAATAGSALAGTAAATIASASAAAVAAIFFLT